MLSIYTSYTSLVSNKELDNTRLLNDLDEVKDNITSLSFFMYTIPVIVLLKFIIILFWPDVGISAIPDEPPANRVPPVILNVPFLSIEPLPSFVGPYIIRVPLVITMLPFESTPSPEAVTVIVPPFIVSV